ncbi:MULTISPECIES: arabinan endo-1,5-alpha-L-arabinosidase [Streptomyces]|uniref:arabinan endo-1,5-alpha-L-arabinosidase n=1 Tax=Streptomyces TaxID=1883 RepID=UPI0034210B57
MPDLPRTTRPRSARTALAAGAALLACLTPALPAAAAPATPYGAGAATASPASAPPEAGYPDPRPLTGHTVVHDPSAIRLKDGTLIVYATHAGLEAHVSRDGKHWGRAGSAFETVPDWWRTYSAEGDAWAPELVYRNGTYWLYYAVSSFGSNNSAIGLATSPTGRPGSWTDHGKIFASSTADKYNAIDPGIVESRGKLWMAFGSFWTGIYMIELDPRTGRPAATGDDLTKYHLATRPDAPHAVEAPYVVKHGRYYYLFVSYDRCCAGTDSTYNIRVGRATKPTGPYTDREVTPMTEGGGTLLLKGHGRYIGPGGQSVLKDRGRYLLIHHYYDAEDNGTPKLGINSLAWGHDGWPSVAP